MVAMKDWPYSKKLRRSILRGKVQLLIAKQRQVEQIKNIISLRSIYQNHLVFNCHRGYVGQVAVEDLMLKYVGDTTVEAVEKSAIFLLRITKDDS